MTAQTGDDGIVTVLHQVTSNYQPAAHRQREKREIGKEIIFLFGSCRHFSFPLSLSGYDRTHQMLTQWYFSVGSVSSHSTVVQYRGQNWLLLISTWDKNVFSKFFPASFCRPIFFTLEPWSFIFWELNNEQVSRYDLVTPLLAHCAMEGTIPSVTITYSKGSDCPISHHYSHKMFSDECYELHWPEHFIYFSAIAWYFFYKSKIHCRLRLYCHTPHLLWIDHYTITPVFQSKLSKPCKIINYGGCSMLN